VVQQAALDNLLAMLRSATAHLAEPPEAQIVYLEGWIPGPQRTNSPSSSTTLSEQWNGSSR
jgi:hypothetical protein